MVRIDSDNNVAAYVHGGRIGVLVEVKGGDAELARGLAMHIAAMNPPHVKASDVPADFIAKEKEIELAKMSEKDRAKPAEIRSEEHTSELQSLMRISYAVFCLKKKKTQYIHLKTICA